MVRFSVKFLSGIAMSALVGACQSSNSPGLQDTINTDSSVVITDSRNDTNTDSDTNTDAVTEAEIRGMLYMREEEKLARDVYLTLHDTWLDTVFSNIASSEQRHMDAMLNLLENYGLQDPASTEIGVFNNAELKDLYNQLLNSGLQSNISALMVGALIEEVDMRDIQQAIDDAIQADIISTYDSLLCGSRNHLRAFVGRIEELGVIYQAQVLSQDEVDAIVNTPAEQDCGR